MRYTNPRLLYFTLLQSFCFKIIACPHVHSAKTLKFLFILSEHSNAPVHFPDTLLKFLSVFAVRCYA